MDFKNIINTIQQANVTDMPWLLPDNSIDCCVTSPPYWSLRDYGVTGQLGQEKTPDEYVTNMVSVFEEVRRVLKPEGTLWINIGDTYYGGKGSNGASKAYTNYENTLNKKALITTAPGKMRPNDRKIEGLKQKDLVGIPWMVAFALRSAGWYLRQDIIWHKPNPMPESVTDRCTRAHEYLFMFSKSKKYFYDAYAIREPLALKTLSTYNADLKGVGDGTGLIMAENRAKSIKGRQPKEWKEDKQRGHSRRHNGFNDRWDKMTVKEQQANGANKRSVWTVSTVGFPEAHFATFPEALITPCILAGCPKDGIVLDHFMGAGTTALVAKSHGRNYIGYELNPEYIDIANKRLKKHFGMFA